MKQEQSEPAGDVPQPIAAADESVAVENDTVAGDSGAGHPGDRKPLRDQFADLVEDARTLAQVELEYYKTKLSVNLQATRTVLILFTVGATLGITTILAMILGILLIASHYLGPVAATGLVTGTTLLLTTILITMAIKRARKLPLDEETDDTEK
ncbi:Putative Holin-X, holin superfamily III [Parasphingorhabdus marina DSM 22363]|uniref:Putative Holin-X, holin superfamily III n=1 Tax=Parasphingorhabdus marina DSM 22363 TaxID=1123272 RepID=A0A1N6FUB4_9SPHN|nr:phage holin family protein [Parasphingorhabdus marina]SIN98833.1 Putative Holin-X, holin superfamily III [Parasphingorhabdus marina DSM 22363]